MATITTLIPIPIGLESFRKGTDILKKPRIKFIKYTIAMHKVAANMTLLNLSFTFIILNLYNKSMINKSAEVKNTA